MSWSSYLANQLLTDLPHHKMLISQMIVYGISHCTCRSPNIAPADLPPSEQQLHEFLPRQLMSFLHWELNIWQTKSWQIYPPQMVISQIPALTAHISFLVGELQIWQTRSWQIYPSWMTILQIPADSSYFIPSRRAPHMVDQVLADLPQLNGNFTDSCSDSSYFIPTQRGQHLADQVWAHIPPC